jgi:hypothetical protein
MRAADGDVVWCDARKRSVIDCMGGLLAAVGELSPAEHSGHLPGCLAASRRAPAAYPVRRPAAQMGAVIRQNAAWDAT